MTIERKIYKGENFCRDCKYYAQGVKTGYCANPKQTNKDFKEYVYWSFGCDLLEKGTHQSMKKL